MAARDIVGEVRSFVAAPQQFRPPAGFRALQVPPGAYRRDAAAAIADELRHLSAQATTRILHAVVEHGALAIDPVSEEQPATVALDDIPAFIRSVPERRVVLLVDDFERLPCESQIAFMAELRGQREQGRELFVVVAGAWSFVEFDAKWRGDPACGSPPFNGASPVNGLFPNEIWELMSSRPPRQPPTCLVESAEYLYDQTRGDSELVDVAIHAAAHAVAPADEVFAGLSERPEIAEIAARRAHGISAREKLLLEAAMRYQRVSLDSADRAAESLFLRGMLRPAGRNGSASQHWEIQSPVIRAVLVKDAHRLLGCPPFHRDTAGQLFDPIHPSVRRAYQVLASTENLLRNAVVLALGTKSEHELDSAVLALLSTDERRAAWRRERADARDRNLLLRRPVAGYLEFSALCDVILSEPVAAAVGELFPDKGALRTHLDELTRLRRHVAHCRLVAPTVAAEIQTHADFFEHHCAEAGNRFVAAAEMASAKLELGGAELYPVDGGARTRIVASVKNVGEALKRVRIQLLDGEKCIDEFGEPQSFEPGQGRRLIFTGPAALEPGRLRVRATQW